MRHGQCKFSMACAAQAQRSKAVAAGRRPVSASAKDKKQLDTTLLGPRMPNGFVGLGAPSSTEAERPVQGDEQAKEPIGDAGSYSDEAGMLEQLERERDVYFKRGDTLLALQRWEMALAVRKRLHGIHSPKYVEGYHELVLAYNTFAMQMLAKDETLELAKDALDKARGMVEQCEFGRLANDRAITCNNLGALFRRKGDLMKALEQQRTALAIEVHWCEDGEKPSTHLNLCSVLSQLGKHADALEHAQAAMRLLQHALSHRSEPSSGVDGAVSTQTSLSPDIVSRATTPADDDANSARPTVRSADDENDLLCTLAVACYDVAVELESLGHLSEAIGVYERACRLCVRGFGARSEMEAMFRESHASAVALFDEHGDSHAQSLRPSADNNPALRPVAELHAAEPFVGLGPWLVD